jgi:phi LC3 family holin
MKINWKVRIKSKAFWVSMIPAVLLLIQVVAAVFGFKIDLGDLGNKLLAVVNAVFAVLAILGVVTDPTTPGLSDSTRALTYVAPGVTPATENTVAGSTTETSQATDHYADSGK